MHLIVLLAMIGKVPAEWFGSGPRWHSLIDTVQSEQAADVIGARVYRMSHGPSLDRMSNSSIPKKEIEKGDRRRATTVHSLAFPILSHPYVILMS